MNLSKECERNSSIVGKSYLKGIDSMITESAKKHSAIHDSHWFRMPIVQEGEGIASPFQYIDYQKFDCLLEGTFIDAKLPI